MPPPTIVADRLYGISMRPQELALYGEKVAFDLRYSPIYEQDDEVTDTHFKLLVFEISADLPADDELGKQTKRIQLVKCGWELELKTTAPCRVGSLEELPEEMPRLLGKVAETINELARRARLEAPIGPELVTTLLHQYRLEALSDNESQ
ncbi:MAG: hypothetical protein H0W83_14815 [Planctomycetes bacterium]|nr:hypothetical protein [Planctomycetota bacterium]